MNTYEVVFGNPSKEVTTSIEVKAPDEQSAIIEARIAAYEPKRKVSAVYLVK